MDIVELIDDSIIFCVVFICEVEDESRFIILEDVVVENGASDVEEIRVDDLIGCLVVVLICAVVFINNVGNRVADIVVFKDNSVFMDKEVCVGALVVEIGVSVIGFNDCSVDATVDGVDGMSKQPKFVSKMMELSAHWALSK